MKEPKILVTTATGKTGSAVVAELLSKGFPVRAIVRSRDPRSERLERLGAETVVADVFDPDQLMAAMKGTRRAYFCPVFHPHMLQSAMAFAVAAREERLESIVQMSQWLSSPTHPSLATRQTWLVDNVFAMIPGVAHTIVNPGWFADNYLRLIDFAALLGVFPILTGESMSAPVSNEDIARVVAAVLMNPAGHEGKRYRPTGPRLLSGREIAGILERVLGNRVIPIDMPLWMLYKAAPISGALPFEISGLRHYVQDHKSGAFEVGGGTTDVVQELTGRPAEDFETTARRYAALPFAQKTAGNRLKAAWNFLRMPFHPGFKPERDDRVQEHPVPSVAKLAIESERWQAEHVGQLRPDLRRVMEFETGIHSSVPVSTFSK